MTETTAEASNWSRVAINSSIWALVRCSSFGAPKIVREGMVEHCFEQAAVIVSGVTELLFQSVTQTHELNDPRDDAMLFGEGW